MCASGRDYIDFNFTFPDMPPRGGIQFGTTYCDQWNWPHYNQIEALDTFYYYDCPESKFNCDDAEFDQTLIYRRFLGQLMAIDARITPRNPMKFNQKKYNCEILGTTGIPHFGPTGSEPAPKVNVRCDYAELRTE